MATKLTKADLMQFDTTRPAVILAVTHAEAQRLAYQIKAWFAELGIASTVSLAIEPNNTWRAIVTPITAVVS